MSADYRHDLAAAVAAVLASTPTADSYVAQRLLRAAYDEAAAAAGCDGFMGVVGRLAYAAGAAWADDRPYLARALLGIIEVVAVYRVREEVISTAMGGLESDLAETYR